ncbi:hypothetical protein BDB01DRAFT_798885 [Pilobolus umbonatus]|nr:hypothetical protein BDB01DRAFT_798885 [Pilobolus umbonatus]
MKEIYYVNPSSQLKYTNQTLLKLYGVDIFSAFSSSFMVAPFISIVDRSIIENMNGKRVLMDGIRYGARSLVTRPFQFLSSPQFRLILSLYFSTYASANMMETTCEHYNVDSSTASLYKFITTSLVNVSVCIYKDKAFTRLFSVTPPHSFPKFSYILFALRDSLTIAASFNAPTYVASLLETKSIITSQQTARTVSQLVCPTAVQFISTPLHLLALDLYNRPRQTVAGRSQLIRKEYFKSALARIGRIGPAFGIGGIGNTYIRGYRQSITT